MYELKKKTETKAQKYLTEANKLVTEGLANEKIQEFELRCMVLSNLIKGGQEHATSLRMQIQHLLMVKKPTDITTFLKELDSIAGGNQAKESFFFVATSNLDSSSMPQQTFVIDDKKIQILKYGEAEKEFKISSRFRDWQLFAEERQRAFCNYSYICIEIQANNVQEAYQIGFRTFELFRGIVNFADDYQTVRKIMYGGIPEVKTLSIIEPSRVQMIFNEKKEHKFDWFTVGYFDYATKKFSKERIEFLLELIKRINSLEETSLKERCLSSFRKYNNGMDGNVAGTSFLEFWKIFELVVIADFEEQGMAEAKVARRIASLFKNELSKDTVMYLCDRRNFITHKGHLSDVDDDELVTIKRFSEEAIVFLLSYANLFKDEATISCYYDMLSKNKTELERLELTIKEANRFLGFKQEDPEKKLKSKRH
jgi:hypothetical protein